MCLPEQPAGSRTAERKTDGFGRGGEGQGAQVPQLESRWRAAGHGCPQEQTLEVARGWQSPRDWYGPDPTHRLPLLRCPCPRSHVASRGPRPPVSPSRADVLSRSRARVTDQWPRRGRGHRERRPEPLEPPAPLTCLSSAHSPCHGGHRGHCRPVHQLVVRRVLHVSCLRRCRDTVGAVLPGSGWGRCRPRGHSTSRLAECCRSPGALSPSVAAGSAGSGSGVVRGRPRLRAGRQLARGPRPGEGWQVSAAPRAGTEASGIPGTPSVSPLLSAVPLGQPRVCPAVTGQPRQAPGDRGLRTGSRVARPVQTLPGCFPAV